MNYVDTKELDARTSSCGCNSSGIMCPYHQGLEDGYKKGISERISNQDVLFFCFSIAIGQLLGVLVYKALNNLL